MNYNDKIRHFRDPQNGRLLVINAQYILVDTRSLTSNLRYYSYLENVETYCESDLRDRLFQSLQWKISKHEFVV